MLTRSTQRMTELRPSPIHGQGVFALRRIRKGTRIVEYTGERISREEADARYGGDGDDRGIVLLFVVDDNTLIDAGRGGNEARYINHSCEPNGQATIEDSRVFIEAIRDIPRGEELTIDYHLDVPERKRAEWVRRYPCHCGAPTCRGTLVAPRQRPSRKQ